ncbi:hypothetical protein [Streptomyces albogriseolus]|uniref:hypothetical protein n=1 Tax=Streptomyces albogriseolus TaxID=1887 RepID=UPI002257F5D9|nr:hypothetical protein [Streptomyces viridodiastaticus]MCX4624434.1 hypothetical protein [Streptomyces viridodiastaticus]
MDWAHLGIDAARTLVWPVTILAVIFLFRRQIRELLPHVQEAEFGGLKLRLDTLQKEVKESPENTRRRLSSEDLTATRLAIEEQLIELSQVRLGFDRRRTRHPEVLVSVLSDKGVLSESVAASLTDYFWITDQLLRAPSVDDNDAMHALCVGDMLFANVRHRYLVEHLVHDFMGHGVWQPPPGEPNKYHFWSVIASEVPEFDYRYEVLTEAVGRFKERDQRAEMPLPALSEFVEILKFRREEIRRVLDLPWGTEAAARMRNQGRNWNWPEEWGHIGWHGPVVRPDTPFEVEKQYFLTSRAIELYSNRLSTLG